MSTDIENSTQPSTASLVSGILGDLTQLVEQQLLLTRREIEQEIRHRIAAAVIFGLGLGTLFMSAMTLCLALSHLLHLLASPPGSDQAWLPMWAAHAVVAGFLLLLGGALLLVGRAKFESVAQRTSPSIQIIQEPRR